MDSLIFSPPLNGLFQGNPFLQWTLPQHPVQRIGASDDTAPPLLKWTVPLPSPSKNGLFQGNHSPSNTPISLPLALLAHNFTPMLEASKDFSPYKNSFFQYSQSKE